MNLVNLHGNATAAYRWLRAHLAENGQWQFGVEPGIDIYYKAPWCFAANGDQHAAALTLAYIEQNYLRPDGDLCAPDNPVINERHAFYQHAFVAIGARLGGRPDMATRMLDFLARQQHPVLGAWGSRANVLPQRWDTISTAAVGLAFIESHRLDEAERAARFLHFMLEQQPDPGAGFFFSADSGGELLTDFADEHEAIERHVRFAVRGQLWWAIGFPVLFLARLYEESGDRFHLDSCLRYLGMIDHCHQAWNDASSGKLAGGCAVLYRTTGEQGHRRNALRAASALVARQNAVGGWYRMCKGPGPGNFQPNAVSLEISTEFAHWLALVSQTIAQGDGTSTLQSAFVAVEKPVARWMRQAERMLLQQRLLAGQKWYGWKVGLRQRILRRVSRT